MKNTDTLSMLRWLKRVCFGLILLLLVFLGSFLWKGPNLIKYLVEKPIAFILDKNIIVSQVLWKIQDPFTFNFKNIQISVDENNGSAENTKLNEQQFHKSQNQQKIVDNKINQRNETNNSLIKNIKCDNLNIILKLQLASNYISFIPNLNISVEHPVIQWSNLPISTQYNKIAENTFLQLLKSKINNFYDVIKYFPLLADMSSQLSISKGEGNFEILDSKKIIFYNFSGQLLQNSVFQPAQLKLESHILTHLFGVDHWLPFSFLGNLEFQNGEIIIHQAKIEYMKLPMLFEFKYSLAKNTFDLLINSSISDLSQVPMNQQYLPLSNFLGQLNLNAHFFSSNENLKSGASVEGNIKFSIFNGKAFLNLKNDSQILLGDGRIDLNGLLNYKNNKWFIDFFKWNLDLSQTELFFKNILKKQQGIALVSDGLLKYDNILKFENFNFILDQLKLKLDGEIADNDKIKSLNLQILPTDLKGFEKILLPFSEGALSGQIQGNIFIDGLNQNNENLNIEVTNLSLNKVQGKLQYHQNSIAFDGPFYLNIGADFNYKQETLYLKSFHSRLDLSHANINWMDYFVKSQENLFNIAIEAQNVDQYFELKNSLVQTSAGNIIISGKWPKNSHSEININLETKHFIFAEFKKRFPSLSEQIPNGLLTGRLNLFGIYTFKNILNDKMSLMGQFNFKIPSLNLNNILNPKSNDQANVFVKNKQKIKKDPNALMQSSNLFQLADLKFNFDIDELKWNQINFQKVKLDGQLVNETLTSQLAIEKVMGGKLFFHQLKLPLTIPDPKWNYDLTMTSLDMHLLCNYFYPNYKDFMRGKISGRLIGGAKLAQSSHFYQDINSEGQIKMVDAVFPTMPVLSMLYQRVQDLPGLSDKPKLTYPLTTKLSLQSKIVIDKQKIDFIDFVGIDNLKNEIKFNGKLDFGSNLEFKGTSAFVTSPLTGPFYDANKDKKNRLIVPLNLTGNLQSPQLTHMEDSIKMMLMKTVEFETKKTGNKEQFELIQKADELRNQAISTIEQKKKQLNEELNKKIKGLAE